MASIQKRPDGRWRARYRDETGKEHARHFPRKIDAQKWLDGVTASVVTGRYVDPRAGNLTFATWFATWEERQVWARGTKLSAAQALQSTTFSDVPMKKILPLHVQEWATGMAKRGLAPKTIKVRANFVRSAFIAAVKNKIIAD